MKSLDQTRIAIVQDGTSPLLVVSWVRGDTPDYWHPPIGFSKVRELDLPEGWVEQPPPLPPCPESVTPYQFRSWMILHGIPQSRVDAMISAISDTMRRDLVRVAWEYGLEVRRAHPFVEEMGVSLGMDEQQIDQAFREAAVIQ